MSTPDMLWDPTFATWQEFGVRSNSSMVLLSPDLSTSSDVFFGFDESRQQEVLEAASAST